MKAINFLVYKTVVLLCKVVAKLLYPSKVYGREHLKQKEPYILYVNHIKILDPIVVVGNVLKRKSYFMGKEELFQKRFQNWFFRAICGYPVKRGSADMSAIKSSIDYLNSGSLITIFPEGTRNTNENGELMEFHNGMGIIALRAKCNLIPCYIDSPQGYKLFKRFKIYIGEPINIKDYEAEGLKKENLSTLMDDCLEKMVNLIPKY